MQDILQRLLRRPLCLIAVSYVVVSFVVQIFAASPLSRAAYQNIRASQGENSDLSFEEYAKVSLIGRLEKREIKNGHQIYYLKQIQIIEIQNSKQKSKQNSNIVKENTEKEAVCYMASGVEYGPPSGKDGRSEREEIPIGRWLFVRGEVLVSEHAENDGQFDAKEYEESLGVSVRLWNTQIIQQGERKAAFDNLLVNIKQKVAWKYHSYLGKENAGVLCAMLLGDKTSMDTEIKKLYRKSGIAHVLAISGLHISLLGMLLYRFLRRCYIPPFICSMLGIGGVLVYIKFVGASISSFRAVCMFVLFMSADLLGRTYDLLTALAFSALLLLVQKPSAMFEAGFLLSYFAVLGLALVLPALHEQVEEMVLPGKRWQNLCRNIAMAFLPGLSVQVLIFPITLWFYYEFPLYSFLLNLIVVPCMSLVLVSAIIGALPGTGFVLYLTGFLLDGYEWLCRLAEQLPGAVIVTGRPRPWQMALYYLLVVAWLIFCSGSCSGDRSRDDSRERNDVREGKAWQPPASGVLRRLVRVLFPFLCMAIFLLPVHRENRMDMLSVGQGDCICLRDSSGGVVLVDGGSTDVSQAGTYRLLPFLKYHGISEVDAVFLSHAHEDHYSAIVELLEKGKEEGVRVRTLCLSAYAETVSKPGLTGSPSGAKAYEELIVIARRAGCEVVYLNPGDRITCGNMKFDCVYPSADFVAADENDTSMVLVAQLLDFSVLFTGDSTVACDEEVIRRVHDLGVREMDCLKVAHHGSQTSTSRELLEAFDFELALISCGLENSYGHPHKALMERISDAGSKVFVTAESGQVTVQVGKGKVKVRGFKDG